MNVNYSDFIALCRVEDPEAWAPWLAVRADGVYPNPLGGDLTSAERAAIFEGAENLVDPLLRFPCTLDDMQAFLEGQQVYCIDPFDMARWVLSNSSETVTNGKWPWGAYENENLRVLEAAVKRFWVRYDPSDISTAPTNQQVAEWLINHKLSKRLADSIATVLRADGLPPGPR